jgi:hypothetical protein
MGQIQWAAVHPQSYISGHAEQRPIWDRPDTICFINALTQGHLHVYVFFIRTDNSLYFRDFYVAINGLGHVLSELRMPGHVVSAYNAHVAEFFQSCRVLEKNISLNFVGNNHFFKFCWKQLEITISSSGASQLCVTKVG